MKTQKHILILALFLLVGSAMAHTTDPIKKTTKSTANTRMKLRPAEANHIRVVYVNSELKNVSVHISGPQMSFTDNITLAETDEGFSRKYDLSSLEQGRYIIKVKDAEMSVSFKVEKMADDRIWAEYWEGYLPLPTFTEPVVPLVN